MTPITLNLSDDLAARLKQREREIPSILEAGLRRFDIEQARSYEGIGEAIDQITSAQSATDILAIRPAPALASRINELIERGKNGQLTEAERLEWDRYELVEQLIRMSKAKALSRRQ